MFFGVYPLNIETTAASRTLYSALESELIPILAQLLIAGGGTENSALYQAIQNRWLSSHVEKGFQEAAEFDENLDLQELRRCPHRR
jgi:hypothetical protein